MSENNQPDDFEFEDYDPIKHNPGSYFVRLNGALIKDDFKKNFKKKYKTVRSIIMYIIKGFDKLLSRLFLGLSDFNILAGTYRKYYGKWNAIVIKK